MHAYLLHLTVPGAEKPGATCPRWPVMQKKEPMLEIAGWSRTDLLYAIYKWKEQVKLTEEALFLTVLNLKMNGSYLAGRAKDYGACKNSRGAWVIVHHLFFMAVKRSDHNVNPTRYVCINNLFYSRHSHLQISTLQTMFAAGLKNR